MQLSFFIRSNGQSFFVEMVTWAMVRESGYVAQPSTTATKYRGAAFGFLLKDDYVDAKGRKLHVSQTGWRTTRCIPLCQYRAEVAKARTLRIEEIKWQAQREKWIELLKALTFAATVVCPMLRVGTVAWSLTEAFELAESLDTVTKVAESVLINKRTSVIDVLCDVLLDQYLTKAEKGFFLASLKCVYPCLTKRMIKVAGTGFEIWDAYPCANKFNVGQVLPSVQEDSILDDIYRFRMGVDEVYRNTVLRGYAAQQKAWSDYFDRLAEAHKKGLDDIILQPIGLMFEPDCKCSFCKPLVSPDTGPKVIVSPGTRGY